MLMLLFIMSCMSEDMLVYEKEVETYIEVESECEVVEDTDFDFSDLWVDSFVQVRSLEGVDIFWVVREESIGRRAPIRTCIVIQMEA